MSTPIRTRHRYILFAFLAWATMVFAPIQGAWASAQTHSVTLCTAQGFTTVWVTDDDSQTASNTHSHKTHAKSCSLCAAPLAHLPPPNANSGLQPARFQPTQFNLDAAHAYTPRISLGFSSRAPPSLSAFNL